MATPDTKKILAALEANWQAEMDGFHTYTALAKREANSHRRNALRGLAMAEKHHADLVEHLAKDKNQLIKALARERLNTTEEGLSKPMVSAISGAISTAVGAFIPIIPFFFMTGIPAVIVAAVVSLIAHFAVGAAKSLITIRSWWASGFEMTWIEGLEGVVTYIIGIGLGKLGGG
jgi:VIT1/CCC1 family predicted Fe2+/Mn2+ transporter